MSWDWKNLKLAREHMNLKQQAVADRLQVGLATYQRWEQGKRVPHPDLRQKVLEFFKEAFLELEIRVSNVRSVAMQEPSHTPSHPSSVSNSVITFANNHLGSRLFFLVTPPYAGYDAIHWRMEDILKDLKTMNSMNNNDQISRREVLAQVVAIPVGALQLERVGQTVKSSLYEIALPTCAAGIAASWELLKQSSGAVDLTTAFDGVSLYLPVLDDIVQYSSQYRQKASDLAARCAILKTILCWHCASNTDATHYARHAVDYSKQSGDMSLQLSAYNKLAWAYFYENKLKYPLALSTALEAKSGLESAEKKHIPIPPSIRDGIYSTLALMQVVNLQNCDQALGKAEELEPSWECPALMEFTPADMNIETGLIYLRKGDPIAAMARFQKIVDPKQLTLTDPLGVSERGRVDVIIRMAESVLSRRNRDMEEAITFWIAGIQGATALQSEIFFDEAVTIYNIIKYIWPGERRIEELAPLAVHWSVAKKT